MLCVILSKNIKREFDPGSGRTLAACLTHASRTKYILPPSIKVHPKRICVKDEKVIYIIIYGETIS